MRHHQLRIELMVSSTKGLRVDVDLISGYFQMNQPLIDPAEKKGKDEKMASLDVGSEIPLIDASPTSVGQNRLSMNDLKNNSRDYCKRFSEEVTQELVFSFSTKIIFF